MASQTKVNLDRRMFGEQEWVLVEQGALSATAFTYSSGVAAVRLASDVGQVVMLPFQGQQIWSASFAVDGRPTRELKMLSMFDEPRLTQQYLSNYGGFLLHCGFTAMGVPTAQDTHPLHGELPNAAYQAAHIVSGEDEQGPYIGLGGRYEHIVAFSDHYSFEPLLKLRPGSTQMHMSFSATNLKRTEMEYMYLAHINFRPVDDSRLVYSARCTPQTCRVRRSIPSHVKTKPGYREFLDELAAQPERHHVLRPGLAFDPEVVFTISYLADEQGWAHSLQVHPDGAADYVAHRPNDLDKGVRWICRTPDQDALGLVLPATAEPEGYSAEKAKGNVRILPAGETFRTEFIIGALSPAQAAEAAAKVTALTGG